MYVEPNDDLYAPIKKKPVETLRAEDFAQFRAEVEEGEEDPYAVPSYGGTKVSREIEELAEELVSRPREKKANRKSSSAKAKESAETSSESAEPAPKRGAKKKSASSDKNASEKGAAKSSKKDGSSDSKSEEKPEKKTSKREPKSESAPKTPDKKESAESAPEAPKSRSFLAKIKEAISTGRVTSADKPESSERAGSTPEPTGPRRKMRWLTENAKKVLDAAGVESSELCATEGRAQIDALAGMLEALIKVGLDAGKKAEAATEEKPGKESAPKSQKKRPSKAEEVFDLVEFKVDSKESAPEAESDDAERAEPSRKRGRKSRNRADKDLNDGSEKPETSESESADSAFDFEDEGIDPIAFWENLPDDDEIPPTTPPQRRETRPASETDDFEEWDEVGAKKKSARLRKDAQDESLVEAPSPRVKRGGKKRAVESEPSSEPSAAPDSEPGETEKSEGEETKPVEAPEPRARSKRVKKSAPKSEESEEPKIETTGESKQLERFGDLKLQKATLRALGQMGYVEPTPIQAGTIPSVQSGVDVMGQARTGTGKTAAFMIPIIEWVDGCEPSDGPLALVVAPTRELAVQIRDEAQKIAKYRDLSIVAAYGGKPISSQVEKLRKGVDILVGTPGRIIDLNNRGVLKLSSARKVVLDEADRMLDIGFRPDVEKILRKTPSDRQTLLFSATLPPPVVRLAKTYMKDPEKFDYSQKEVGADTIEQFYITVDHDRKFDALVRLLETQNPRQAIVFCRTKRCVDSLGRRLAPKFPGVEAIHGDLQQSKRDRIMRDFRSEKIKILVATDIVGRGIDVSSVSHIVNYDVPQYCDDYVHRVGRAGRMGREGVAFTLVTAEEGSELTRIEIRIDRLLERLELPGFEAYSKPVEEPPAIERKPVFGKATRRIRRAL